MAWVYTLTEDQVEWAWKMRCNGQSLERIADALYVSPKTLSRALNRKYGRTRPERYADLVYKKEPN